MNKKNVFFHLLLLLALAGFISAGCVTTRNTGVAVKEGATEVGQQVAHKAVDVGEKIEDASITSAIKMKFANDELVSASNINVDTNNGHVTLNGTVASQAEDTRAVQIGRSVDGVKSVYSKLIIIEKLRANLVRQ
jgi:hyperosmotically inducible periplasmic protein